MSTPHLGSLTYLFFNVNRALDSGRVASVDEAHDAFWDGEAMEFLEQYDEIDLNLFKDDDSDVHDWDEMNNMFQRYVVHDPYDLSVENNGLAYVNAQIVELIQNGTWNDPNTGQEVSTTDLEIEEDW